MEVILLFVGAMVGSIITVVIFRKRSKRQERPVGTLWIDKSDIHGRPEIYLELSREVEDISIKKYVTFKVSISEFSSH